MSPTPVAEAVKATFKITTAQDKAMDVLVSSATHVALGGGSRSGKTFLLVRAVIIRALKSPNSRHAIFRFRFNSLKSSVILDTLPKVLSLDPVFEGLPPVSAMMNKTDWYMTLPNGSEIWFGGLDDKDRTEKVLGMEFATIYFNECSQIPWGSIELALTRLAQKTENLQLKAYYDFNPPSKIHWTYLRFVEKKNPETKLPEKDPFDFGFYLINPMDNKENLDPKYLAMLDGLSEKKRQRFLFGRFADASDGQLWTVELLAQNRVLGQVDKPLPDFLRIVVAIDPSGSDGQEDNGADEIGIVVMALGTDGHGYLLEDLTGNYKPEEWGRIAVDAYKRHSADRVVGEANYGGDMVRAVIHAVDPDIPYSKVTATRGKVVRAEPISTLYEMQKIHHVGHFDKLEDELCAMTTSGYVGMGSPNRGDALVWAATELFPQMTRKAEDANFSPPKVKTASRSASRFDPGSRRRW